MMHVSLFASLTFLFFYNGQDTRAFKPNVAAWRSGNVVGRRRINEVTLRRARLVLGWVTVFGGQTTSVFHQANSASYPQWDGK